MSDLSVVARAEFSALGKPSTRSASDARVGHGSRPPSLARSREDANFRKVPTMRTSTSANDPSERMLQLTPAQARAPWASQRDCDARRAAASPLAPILRSAPSAHPKRDAFGPDVRIQGVRPASLGARSSRGVSFASTRKYGYGSDTPYDGRIRPYEPSYASIGARDHSYDHHSAGGTAANVYSPATFGTPVESAWKEEYAVRASPSVLAISELAAKARSHADARSLLLAQRQGGGGHSGTGAPRRAVRERPVGLSCSIGQNDERDETRRTRPVASKADDGEIECRRPLGAPAQGGVLTNTGIYGGL